MIKNSIQPGKKLRILIVSQYFWPENFRINDLAAGFVAKGHDVTVLTGLPNYPDGALLPAFRDNPAQFFNYQGITVHRVAHGLRGSSKLRLVLNYLTFMLYGCFAGPWKLRTTQVDVIFVFAVSPITMAIPAILLGRLKRAPVFLWVQDLWPETLSAVGVVKSPFLLSLVGALVRWIYAKCDHILIQSRAFLPSVKRYCATADQPGKVLYFPNWAEQVFSKSEPHPQDVIVRDDDFFTILFAGNVGDAQDFPSILDAAEKLKSQARLRWIIVGDGRAHAWVSAEVARRGLAHRVQLVGRFPLEAMPGFFEAADVLLVSLKSDAIFSLTIPAKIQSYMAAGKPILCMLDGEARLLIEESGSGMSCGAGESGQLAELALEMSRLSKKELASMGENGRQYYLRHFERELLLDRLESHFLDAVAGHVTISDSEVEKNRLHDQ